MEHSFPAAPNPSRLVAAVVCVGNYSFTASRTDFPPSPFIKCQTAAKHRSKAAPTNGDPRPPREEYRPRPVAITSSSAKARSCAWAAPEDEVETLSTGSWRSTRPRVGGLPIGRIVEVYGPELRQNHLLLGVIAEAQQGGSRLIRSRACARPESMPGWRRQSRRSAVSQPDSARPLNIMER